MATTTTSTTNFSDLVTQLVSARAEEELRARAVHAMAGMYVPARFIKGTNTLRYARYADLEVSTTVMTEGTAPTDDALTISSEFFTAAQYGATVAVSDLANLDSPHDLISIAAERVAYKAVRSMDHRVLDEIFSPALTTTVFGATLIRQNPAKLVLSQKPKPRDTLLLIRSQHLLQLTHRWQRHLRYSLSCKRLRLP